MRIAAAVLSVLSVCGALAPPCLGQADTQCCMSLLRVESADSADPVVPFTAAYTYGSSETEPRLIVGEKHTPFALSFSAKYFLGMFQDSAAKNRIRVVLSAATDGKVRSSVSGRGVVNIVRADGDRVGYGWPPPAQ